MSRFHVKNLTKKQAQLRPRPAVGHLSASGGNVTYGQTPTPFGTIRRCQVALRTNLLEGIDNKIKVIKRMAYGFRDDGYVFLKIRAAFPEFG